MKKVLLIMLAFLVFTGTAFAAEVQNLTVKQVGNRVVFEFDVIGEEDETEVTITLAIEGKTYKADELHLEGDYEKVKVGKSKKIYWNVLQDFPKGYSGNVDWEIVANKRQKTYPKYKEKTLKKPIIPLPSF